MTLASRSFYFYIEIAMAIVVLVILLFVVPENFETKKTEYLAMDNLPKPVEDMILEKALEDDLDHKAETKIIKYDGEEIEATYYEMENKKAYLLDDPDLVEGLADKKKHLGAVMYMKDGELNYKYFIQGYETQRLKNMYLVLHNKGLSAVMDLVDEQRLVNLQEGDFVQLTDRQNVLPVFLVFSCSLMGLFIIAAYVFLDKKENMIKAYAVSPSALWQYMLSKVGVLLVTSIISTVIIVVPIMKLQPNYLSLFILLLCSSFFSCALGLLIASFYKEIAQAFGAIFVVMIIMFLPGISYFIPSWEPVWMKFIPSYAMIEGYKESILENGDAMYTIKVSVVLFGAGLVIFMLSNNRYKKTLSI